MLIYCICMDSILSIEPLNPQDIRGRMVKSVIGCTLQNSAGKRVCKLQLEPLRSCNALAISATMSILFLRKDLFLGDA